MFTIPFGRKKEWHMQVTASIPEFECPTNLRFPRTVPATNPWHVDAYMDGYIVLVTAAKLTNAKTNLTVISCPKLILFKCFLINKICSPGMQ